MKKIAIIGAGLSGLTAALLLKEDAEVTLFEKSRGVGGRMSTRRAEPYLFNHGAQYFTARTRAFQNFIQPLLEQNIIQRWNARYVLFDGNRIVERKYWADEEPRYVGIPGMNAVAKYLARDLNIRLEVRIKSLECAGKWRLTDEQGVNHSDFDWVIITTPAPQASDLLPKSSKYFDAIQAIKMLACFSLMLGFEKERPLEFEAARINNADLSWIAANSHKSEGVHRYSLVVHSSENYAAAHIEDNREEVMRHLIAETTRIIGQDVNSANHKTIHGWRYANTADRKADYPIFLDHEQKLAACGDWCFGGRVEGAFNSALNLINKIKEKDL